MKKTISYFLMVMMLISIGNLNALCINDTCNEHLYIKEGKIFNCSEATEVKYTCKDCGATYTKFLPARNHTVVIDKSVVPTCIKSGLTQGSHCSVCGQVIEKQKVVKASGHNVKTIAKKPATYFSKGHTSKKVCKICNKVVVKGKVIPKLKLKMPKATYKLTEDKIIIKYTKVKGANGFQLKYKFKGKVTKKTYNTNKDKTIKINISEKGTYKFSIRAFTKQGSKTAYSDWDKLRKVKSFKITIA